MSKKILAALLAVMMVLSLVPMTALATEEPVPDVILANPNLGLFPEYQDGKNGPWDGQATVSAAAQEDGTIKVTMTATNLMSHSVSNPGQTPNGYWLGIGVPVISEAREGDAGYYQGWEKPTAESSFSATPDGTMNVGEKEYKTFYFNVQDSAKPGYVGVKQGENITTYELDFTNVTTKPLVTDAKAMVVYDATTYNRLPESYVEQYPLNEHPEAWATFPWLVVTYSRNTDQKVTFEVKKGETGITPNGAKESPATINTDAYQMWRIVDADDGQGLGQANPYGGYTVNLKIGDKEVGTASTSYEFTPNVPEFDLKYTAFADTNVVDDCINKTMYVEFKQALNPNTYMWFKITDPDDKVYEIGANSKDEGTTKKFAWSFLNKDQFEIWPNKTGTGVVTGTYTVEAFACPVKITGKTMPDGSVSLGTKTVEVSDETLVVKPAAPDVKVDDLDLTNEQKEALTNALKEAEADAATLGSVAQEAAAKVEYTTTQGADALNAVEGIDNVEANDVNIIVQPFIEVSATKYTPEGEDKELTVDITAKYRVVATTVTEENLNTDGAVKVAGEVEENETPNAVVLSDKENAPALTVNSSIELKVKLPDGFVDGNSIYVLHGKGKEHYHKATVVDKVATFTSDDGLSPFTFKAGAEMAAQIGGSYYETLAEAVNAATDGQTIVLLKKLENADATATVSGSSRTIYFKLANASYISTLVLNGKDVLVNSVDAAVPFVYTASSVTPPSGGGSSGTSGNITVTKPANGTVTTTPSSAKEGDKVTVTVKTDAPYYIVTGVTVKGENGNVVATKNADGTYSFTMPKGSVSVSATISHIYNLFKDVPTDIAEYGTAIKWAVEKGITLGTDTVAYSTFSPYNPCTRAQMVVFLYRAAGSPTVTGTNAFTDVPNDAEIQKAVQWAVSKGITKGTSDTTFDPYGPCTRGQMVTFLHRNHSEPAATGSNNFADVPADAFYKTAVQWAVNEGITNGTGDTTFAPNDACTRVQMVTFLYRDMGK